MAKETDACPDLANATPTGITCPDCGDGEIVPTRGRFGLMYACEHRPKACNFWMNKRPTGQACGYRKTKRAKPCGRPMMQGTKTIPDRCSDKTCPNHHPHKLEKSSNKA